MVNITLFFRRDCRVLGAASALLSLVFQAAAQDAGVPGAYLNHVGGAQVLGMSRAFVGHADGTDAIAWNPAGLGLLRPNVLTLMHTQTAQQGKLEHLAYAQPLYNIGGIGVGYTRLDSGAIPQTDEYNREVGEFRDVQETAMLGYGFSPWAKLSASNPIQRMSVGGTFKYARQKMAGLSVSGYGLDLGFLTRFKRGYGVGLRFQNIMAPKFEYETAADSFPRSVTLGFSHLMFRDRLLATSDFEKGGSGQKLDWRTGLEGTLWQVVKLRGGFEFDTKEFTLGMGYIWGRYNLNYASKSNQGGLSHFMGLSYSFGGYPVVIQASPERFSPIGLTKSTNLNIQVNHARRIYSWEVQIRTPEGELVRTVRGKGAPPPTVVWNGMDGRGTLMPAGVYTYVLIVMDEDGRKETTPAQSVWVEYGTPLDALELKAH